MPRTEDIDRVLIVGAGPVGQVAAGLLERAGVPVTILEREARLPEDLRAGTFHPPSLELMEPLGFTDYLMREGIRVPHWQFRDLNTGLVAEFDLGVLKHDTKFPFRLHCEQWKLTFEGARVLQQRPGIDFRFGHDVADVTQDKEKVTATCRTAGGERKISGRWLVGTDGGRSAVRKLGGFTFEGFTWDELFV